MERLLTMDDGVRVWSTDAGAGPAVVLCHGGPGMWDNLEPLGALVADGTRTIRWEQRGCGRSDRAGPYSVARSLADLDTVREQLAIDAWIVGGHSWGATLALHHVLSQPAHARALIYVSGVGIGRAWNAAYHEAADGRLSAGQRARRDELRSIERTEAEERELCSIVWSPDFADRATAVERATAMADAPFTVNRAANAAINAEVRTWDEDELARRCAGVGIPVLIVHGSDDPRPAWAVESLAAALPACTVHIVAGAGHLPWVEAPDETRRTIATFLDDHDLVG